VETSASFEARYAPLSYPTEYGPGTSLTKQTGEIPDTVIDLRRRVKERHALESEQCDGREGTVCL